MRKDNIADIYPLSPMQEGMLVETLLAPESQLYFQQEGFTIKGDFNVPAFKLAWEEVMARHDVLRTAFLWERRDQPLQIVYRRLELPWDYLDWRGRAPDDDRRAQLNSYLEADREQGFELSKAPLIRLTLIRLDEEVFYFVWRFHHTILDNWSVSLLFNEVTTLYDAFSQGRSIELKQAPPFRDYIGWLRRQDTAGTEKFWQESLKGFTTPTPFRVERTRALETVESHHHRSIVKLSKEATRSLQSLARQNQLTLNTLVQGAWALLLSRYSGEESVVFGSVVSGRPSDLIGSDAMVGMFINNLPVRVRVSPDAPLIEWLKELQAQQAVAREFEYSPLTQVQGWSEVPRGLPLFESFIAFENIPKEGGTNRWGANVEVRSNAAFDNPHFPLFVLAWPGEELQLEIGADGRRFDAGTHARLSTHLETILEGFVADPKARLSERSLLTEAERQLLVEWNNPAAADGRSPLCLHELFEAQAGERPDAVAVVYEGERLTYRQLNHRTNQLARHLRSLGVGPEVLVGIYMERSLETVIGILGILKAGGGYLPLDVAYPKERLAYMLADAQTTVLLTQEHLLENLPAGAVRAICLDSDWDSIAREGVENLSSGTTPGNLAYTIYTSGSTGQPKGVIVTHDNVTRLFSSTADYFHFSNRDVWTMFHSHAFDFSVWEIWGALLYGGRLVVVPYMVSRSPEAFYEMLLDEQVSVLNQTPSAFRQLLLAAEETSEPLADNPVDDVEDSLQISHSPVRKSNLRLVIFGGEALEFSSLRPWFDLFGEEQPQLVNMYGITETTVHVTYRRLRAADSQLNGGSLIGRPMRDLQTFVLDERLQPAPVGVPGEIYVGGEGLARGYLNRSELTATRFIPNPFGELPGGRLYRTGDSGRLLDDGEIEYLGRIDQQVKIRGFRIELGEIEAALAQLPGVNQVVVTARDYQGEMRLVAYIVRGAQPSEAVNQVFGGKDERSPEQDALPNEITAHARGFLQEKLPEYMIPSAFVVLDALPLTAHGKVDRKALPLPEQKRSESDISFVAPRTPVEKKLVEMWRELLGVEGIGIHDSFYELGGHSLLLTRLASCINKTFHVDLPLRTLFNTRTIVEMTTAIAARQVDEEGLTDAAQLIEKLKRLSPAEVDAMLEAEAGELLEV